MPENTLFTYRTEGDGAHLLETRATCWDQGQKATLDRFWMEGFSEGDTGLPWTSLTQVSSRWSKSDLFFYFECWRRSAFEGGAGSADRRSQDIAAVWLDPGGSQGGFAVEVEATGRHSFALLARPQGIGERVWKTVMESKVRCRPAEKIWRAVLRLPLESIVEAAGLSTRASVGDAWRVSLRREVGAEKEEDRELLYWPQLCYAERLFSLLGHLIFMGGP